MMKLIGLASALVVLFSGGLAAQTSSPARVYRSQYLELRTKAIVLLGHARTTDSPQAKLSLQEEALALTKLVHRLGEEAARDNLERSRRGQAPDKSLSLVFLGCSALDFLLQSLNEYIDTGDLAFAQLAKQGISLMDSIEGFF